MSQPTAKARESRDAPRKVGTASRASAAHGSSSSGGRGASPRARAVRAPTTCSSVTSREIASGAELLVVDRDGGRQVARARQTDCRMVGDAGSSALSEADAGDDPDADDPVGAHGGGGQGERAAARCAEGGERAHAEQVRHGEGVVPHRRQGGGGIGGRAVAGSREGDQPNARSPAAPSARAACSRPPGVPWKKRTGLPLGVAALPHVDPPPVGKTHLSEPVGRDHAPSVGRPPPLCRQPGARSRLRDQERRLIRRQNAPWRQAADQSAVGVAQTTADAD